MPNCRQVTSGKGPWTRVKSLRKHCTELLNPHLGCKAAVCQWGLNGSLPSLSPNTTRVPQAATAVLTTSPPSMMPAVGRLGFVSVTWAASFLEL